MDWRTIWYIHSWSPVDLLTDPTLSIPLQRHQQVKKSMYPVKYLLNKYFFFPLRMSSFLRTKSLHKHVYIPVVTPLFVSWNKTQ